MSDAIKIFREQNGYATMKELKAHGIHTQTVQALLKANAIEKLKPGLYKLADMPLVSEQGMIDVCKAMPKAVICLHSALSHYELTTTLPSNIMIALPRGSKPVNLYYPPIQVFTFSGKVYQAGLKEVQSETGNFKIYAPEKTIVDCFRFRLKIGEDVAIEGLRSYLQKPDFNLNKLLEYARLARIKTVIQPYIKAMIST
jgi:predicted transcriptional regulator of viral defense system